MLDILQQVVAAVERNEPAALATVVEVVGASPAKVGAKILVRGDGPTIGTAGGGRLEQAIVEVFAPRPTLLIVGGGHIGKPLAEIARVLNYDVRVVDVRDERGNALDPASITAHTYIVLVTEDYVSDEAALRAVIESPAPYIGMIGSRRKCRMVLEHLRADGVADASRLCARVRAPIGLDLGGTTPAEIALAILAEIEMARHQGRADSRSKG